MLKVIAATIDDALALSVDELAWGVLGELKVQGPKPMHLGNFFLHLMAIYEPALGSGQPTPHSKAAEYQIALGEAYALLEKNGLAATVYEYNYGHAVASRRGRTIDTIDQYRGVLVEASLRKDALHPVIQKDAWPLYARGKFDLAVFEAFKQVEIAVRNKGGYGHADYGKNLMVAAFNPEKGPLLDVLLSYARRPLKAVRAEGAAFEAKEALKQRGYRWDPGDANRDKAWWILTEHAEAEIAWLNASIYTTPRTIRPIDVPPTRRFTSRLWSTS